MRSIRFTTTWLTFLGVSLLGLALCFSTYWIARTALVRQFDHDLLLEFQNLASVARVWPDEDFYVDLDFDVATQYNSGGSRLFQVWDEDGNEVIDQSPMLEEQDYRLSYPPEQVRDVPDYYDLILPDGRAARAVFQRINTQWGWVEKQPDLDVAEAIKSTVVQLLVVRERNSLNQSLAMLRHWTLAVALLLPMLCFVVVRTAVGHGIRPLRQLANDVSAIRHSHEKLNLPAEWPAEITPVAGTVNALLERLDDILQRERRFTADVAHELRTPLAELRTATDVALRSSGDHENFSHHPERLLTAVRQANELSRSMADLVNSMLLLARFQSGQSQPQRAEVNLSEQINRQISAVEAKIGSRGIRLTANVPEDIRVCSDERLLAIILSNLLTNAAEYTPPDCQISLRLATVGNHIKLIISNPAPGLNDSDIEQLFQPFWRKGESRTQRDHYGLGLAITREACLSLGVQLDARLDQADLLSICLDFGDYRQDT